jgi:hypothetical protein
VQRELEDAISNNAEHTSLKIIRDEQEKVLRLLRNEEDACKKRFINASQLKNDVGEGISLIAQKVGLAVLDQNVNPVNYAEEKLKEAAEEDANDNAGFIFFYSILFCFFLNINLITKH